MIYYIIMIVFSPYTAIIPAVYSVNLLFKRKVRIEKNYWSIGLFSLFLYSMFSGIVNKSFLSFLASFGLFLYFSLFVFAQNYFIKMSRINMVLKIVTHLSVIAAIGGVIEKITFILLNRPEHRIFSSFGNPNMTGAWFANIILIIFYLQGTKKSSSETLTYNLVIILIAIALLLTESTGAFIALIGGLFVYYISSPNKNKKEIITVCSIVGALSLIFIFVQNKIAKTTPIGEFLISFNSRVGIWEGSTNMFFKKPILGWGLLGTFERGSNFIFSDAPNLHDKIISFLIHPHNLWLTFLVATGVIGLGIYLYIKFNLYKNMIKVYKEKNPIFPLITATNAMVIIQGMVDCTLYAPQLGTMFICMGAITYNIANDRMIKKGKIVKSKKNNDVAV